MEIASLATQQPVSSVADLRRRFRTVRLATLAFAAPLSAEDQMVQSCAEASPTKWHLAHVSWFFETFVLSPYATGYRPFHSDFSWLFNSYYNALGEMPAKKLRASFSRPALAEILSYRSYVDDAVSTLLEALPEGHEDEILRRVSLGLEHEQQHLELIATDIKHALFTNPLHPAYRDIAHDVRHEGRRRAQQGPGELRFTTFAAGLTEIGVSPDPDDALAFAFDNETPRHTVYLQPFALANRLVTAAEYLAFINDSGYTRPELWLSEGWSTQRAESWHAPLYWQRDGSSAAGWKVYTLDGFRPLEELLDTPVCHVSLFEADAFARWSGCRLPTEFEWEHAAGTPPTGRATAANMLETGRLHPEPAPSLPSLGQMYGDVWEWTSSGYTGYPGYKPLPGALGEYNGKFMSSQVILRGGSCVTPADHIRATYRNFFPPATRWQFSGLRLAKDV